MKKILFLLTAVIFAAAMAMISCDSDPNDDNGDPVIVNEREVGWAPAPAGWVEWPASRLLATVPTTEPAATITENADGSFRVVTQTRAWGIGEGQNRLTFALDPGVEFRGGIYVALTLPTEFTSLDWNRPEEVVLFAGGALNNNQFTRVLPNEGFTWMEGRVSVQHDVPQGFEINHFELQLWFTGSYAPDMPFEFTINRVLVAETYGVPGEPAWRPGWTAPPSDWTELTLDTLIPITEYSPSNVTVNGDGSITVQTSVRDDGDMQNRMIFGLPAGQTFRGLHLDITLPQGDFDIESNNMPYQLDLLSPRNNWDGSNQRRIRPNYWIEGPVSIMWDGAWGLGSPGIPAITTPRNEFELQIRWENQLPGESFEFTINRALVQVLNN